jgi:hypothetical protein
LEQIIMDYYCWYEYYFAAPVSKNVKGDELRFAQGHQHGVQPSAAQWQTREASLYANVQTAGDEKDAAYPGDAAVLAAAVKKTRTAR